MACLTEIKLNQVNAEHKRDSNMFAPVTQVDCTANTEVCGKYGVSGYPTLKIFRGGEVSEDYQGPREAGTVTFFAKMCL